MIDVSKYNWRKVTLCSVCMKELIPEIDGNSSVCTECKKALHNPKPTNKAEQLSYLNRLNDCIKKGKQIRF